jgi:hypothetical protein
VSKKPEAKGEALLRIQGDKEHEYLEKSIIKMEFK